MLRIFRVDHQKDLSIQNPRFEYIDITKDTDIRKEYINGKRPPRMKDSEYQLYLDNYVIWKEEGLFMRSIRNYLELKVEESELPKTFYGYYELRDAPVIVFYLNDEELEFLKSRNKATRVRYEFFDLEERTWHPRNWYLLPEKIVMGLSLVLYYSSRTDGMKNGSRVFYFTDNGRLYCGTIGTGSYASEVVNIQDCPHAYYDISEKLLKFTKHDSILGSAQYETRELSTHLGIPLNFLDKTYQPDDDWVDHQKELSIQNPRFEYVDITKDTDIRKQFINGRRIPRMKDRENPLYLDNYVIWKDEGLFMRSIRNYLELKVEESELPKTFYGYYELRDVPVIVYYLNDEELEFLKSKNKATRVIYEFFDLEDGNQYPFNWYLFPGRISMGDSFILTYALTTKEMKNGSRVFYFTSNRRLFCGTIGTAYYATEVDSINDCPHAYYDISEKLLKFTVPDSILGDARFVTRVLSTHLGIPLNFLDETYEPEEVSSDEQDEDLSDEQDAEDIHEIVV